MESSNHFEFEDELKKAFRHQAPPQGLEKNVLSTLHQLGYLQKNTIMNSKKTSMLIFAFSAVFFFGGFFIAKKFFLEKKDELAGYNYVMLLTEDTHFKPGKPESQLVTEYTNWMNGVIAKGYKITGMPLEMQKTIISNNTETPVSEENSITGFFLIQATSKETLEALVKTSPHVQYGGGIMIKTIPQF